jgi:hypothetical protein
MKVTYDNIESIGYYAGRERQNTPSPTLLKLLLYELKEINILSTKNGGLYIDYIDTHTEYSPERTDPCPDYYGYFELRLEEKPYVRIGDYMTIDELDTVLCVLTDFVEYNDISYDEKN